jgi:hypothetical protein
VAKKVQQTVDSRQFNSFPQQIQNTSIRVPFQKKILGKKRLGCPIAESLYQQNNKGGSDK